MYFWPKFQTLTRSLSSGCRSVKTEEPNTRFQVLSGYCFASLGCSSDLHRHSHRYPHSKWSAPVIFFFFFLSLMERVGFAPESWTVLASRGFPPGPEIDSPAWHCFLCRTFQRKHCKQAPSSCQLLFVSVWRIAGGIRELLFVFFAKALIELLTRRIRFLLMRPLPPFLPGLCRGLCTRVLVIYVLRTRLPPTRGSEPVRSDGR